MSITQTRSLTTTLAAIREHGPCTAGWRTLVKALGEYDDDEPLPLSHIVKTNGIHDALWALRTQPDNVRARICVQFAIDCAERTLPKFEAKYPDDTRPREALAAPRAYLADPSKKNAAAAHAAAADAADAAAGANCGTEREWQTAHLIELMDNYPDAAAEAGARMQVTR